MSTEQITLLASLVTPVVVAAGAAAAFFQLKHLRMSNELQGFLHLMDRFNSERMIEARLYCLHELPAEFAAHPERFAHSRFLDVRILLVGNFFTEVGSLVYHRALARRYIVMFLLAAEQAWNAMAPMAELHRAAQPGRRGVWAAFEYLAYLQRTGHFAEEQYRHYHPELREKFLDPGP